MNKNDKQNQPILKYIYGARTLTKTSWFELKTKGSILIGVQTSRIQVWSFSNHMRLLRNQDILGQKFCQILYSRKSDWFVSANVLNHVQCWKEKVRGIWAKTQTKRKHNFAVEKLLLNNDEDELIVACKQEIVVWKINSHFLKHYQNLSIKKYGILVSIDLNQLNNKLVACCNKQIIILLGRGLDGKWQQLSDIKLNKFSCNVYFFTDIKIAYKQFYEDITQIFEIENDQLVPKPEDQIILYKTGINYNTSTTLFNKRKEIFIQSHSNNVYFLRSEDGKLKIISDVIQIQLFKPLIAMQNGESLMIFTNNSFAKIYRIYYSLQKGPFII